MKTISKSLLTLFVVLISLISTETQAGGWGILGGVHRNSISGSNGQLSGTFGLGFHARPFEVDLLYSMKKPAENISYNSIQVPFFYRLFFSPFFSVGLGGYLDYFLNTTDVAGNSIDYGLAASLRYHMPIASNTALVFDARYLMGLAALPGKSSDLGLIVGIVFH